MIWIQATNDLVYTPASKLWACFNILRCFLEILCNNFCSNSTFFKSLSMNFINKPVNMCLVSWVLRAYKRVCTENTFFQLSIWNDLTAPNNLTNLTRKGSFQKCWYFICILSRCRKGSKFPASTRWCCSLIWGLYIHRVVYARKLPQMGKKMVQVSG